MGTSDHHNPTGRKPTPLGDDAYLLHFLFLVKLFRLRKNHTFCIPSFHRNDRSINPNCIPFHFSRYLFPPFNPGPSACVCVYMCVHVRAVSGREQLEHLQSSPLTAAQHMAGPGEGWVLSPGKVLTHRQESRATQTPRGRGGNSWTSASSSFIFPPPPHSKSAGTLKKNPPTS